MGFPGGSAVKNPPANVGDTGDTGLIPGLRRLPGEGTGNPHQYSCLENPMDRGAWWATVHSVAKSRTQLKWRSMQNTAGFILSWQLHIDGVANILWASVTSAASFPPHKEVRMSTCRSEGEYLQLPITRHRGVLHRQQPLPISWVLAQLWAPLVQSRVLSGPFLGPNKHPLIKLLVLFFKAYVTVCSTFCFSPTVSTTMSKIPLNDENIYKLSSPGSCW